MSTPQGIARWMGSLNNDWMGMHFQIFLDIRATVYYSYYNLGDLTVFSVGSITSRSFGKCGGSAVTWEGAGVGAPPPPLKNLFNTWFRILKSRAVTMLEYC